MYKIYSNTTLVKVKLKPFIKDYLSAFNSNTTLVKVKCCRYRKSISRSLIQIQHLLKLNDNVEAYISCLIGIQIQHLLKLNLKQQIQM